MKDILNLIATCGIIILVGLAVKGTIENQFTPQTVQHDSPMILDEVVELPERKVEQPEVPVIRFVSFEDEFAVKPLIRNLTEEEWQLLESISIAEAGNQDVEGVALVMLTVLNRVEKNGHSVYSTIYAPNQFYTAGMSGGNELSADARALVRSGWDESQGAIYFCSTGWNYYGDEHLFKHQDHWFSK